MFRHTHHYCRKRCRSSQNTANRLATAVGLLVTGIAIISAATMSVGAADYIAVFLPLSAIVLVAVVVLAMGAIAAWGIKESVTFVGVMTLIEIGASSSLFSRAYCFCRDFSQGSQKCCRRSKRQALGAILSTTLLAVFAFIGFESLANVAEEVDDPPRTIPRAIFLTLAIATLLYMLVVWIALLAVTVPELIQSSAPLALVFERLTGFPSRFMSSIAVVATLNGIIIQIILASRVLDGLSPQGQLPAIFAEVNPKTRPPLIGTTITAALVLLFALFLPLHNLADLTARTLLVFAVVNLSLARIKLRGDPPPEGAFVAPAWVPWAGCATCPSRQPRSVASRKSGKHPPAKAVDGAPPERCTARSVERDQLLARERVTNLVKASAACLSILWQGDPQPS